ncbi:hypothetical protein EDD21DRAFT_366507 [Dissophora ornata]|nr:hypothetical protein EDD21DRAFT_366507 [Dissophora ornata]
MLSKFWTMYRSIVLLRGTLMIEPVSAIYFFFRKHTRRNTTKMRFRRQGSQRVLFEVRLRSQVLELIILLCCGKPK